MVVDSIIELQWELAKACSSANQSKILELMQSGIDINTQDVNGRTLLIWSCMFENMNLYILNYVNLVKYLISNDTKIDLQESNGKTALMWASTHNTESDNNLTIVNFLLKANANIDIKDHEGNTSLMLAIKSGNLRTIRVLLIYSPDLKSINNNGKSVVELAQEQVCGEIYNIVKDYINKLTLRGCFFHWRNTKIKPDYDDKVRKYINLPKEIAYNIIKFCL